MATSMMWMSVEAVDYEFGGWCRRCLLPSGVRVTAMVSIGPSSTLRTFDVCGDCNGSAVDPPPRLAGPGA